MSLFRVRCLYLFLLAFSSVPLTIGQSKAPSPSDFKQLTGLPVTFEQSAAKGKSASFLARSAGMIAEVGSSEIRFALPTHRKGSTELLSVRLQNANSEAVASPAEQQAGEANYMLGSSASWRMHVARFGRLTYSRVYPGIDLAYYGHDGHLEHDFIVQPGGNPSRIQMRFEGAEKTNIQPNGDLLLSLPQNVVVFRKPVAYQTVNGIRHEVPVQFALNHTSIQFQLGQYDRTQPLIIDPVLDYSTFLGDASIYVTAIALDPAGNTYIAGLASIGFPGNTSTSACNSCLSGSNKLATYVTKLNTTGSAVLYTTFIGGSVASFGSDPVDQASALTVDTNGNAIVAGFTGSKDFPLKNAITAGTPSLYDGFLTSLTPDGSALNFSSRLGGSSSASQAANTYPAAITTNAQGDVYVTGNTESAYLPVTPGALQAVTPGYPDPAGFLLKLSSTGALDFGAILGTIGNSSGGTGPSGIAVDSSGVIYVVGTAGSIVFSSPATTPWPITPSAYQKRLIAPSENAPFVTRVAADGSQILSSTLVGTGQASAMALTSAGDVLLAGSPNYNFPITSDAYESNVPVNSGSISSGAGGYFAKVSQDGSQLLYASMFGPTGQNMTISGIVPDSSGNVWLAGTTRGAITTTTPALQSIFSYPSSLSGVGFVAKFDPSLHTQTFASYVDDAIGWSQVHGLAVDANGKAHVAGIASQTFPTTSSAAVKTVTAAPVNYSYTYGYAALIDSDTPGPAVCFANAFVPATQVGRSGVGRVDIVNCGNAPLTVSSLSIQPAVLSVSPASTCPGTVATGASCTVNYTFSPTTAGTTSGALSFATNAPMGANQFSIYANATAPSVYLPAGNNVTFLPSVVGTATETSLSFLGNKGTAPLVVDVSRTAITGPFTLGTTNCGTPLSTNSFCTYSLGFAPTTAGNFSGTLTVYTDDPQTPNVTYQLTASVAANYPTPSLTSISAATVSLDGGPVNLTINGTNFFPATALTVNGRNIAITRQDAKTLSFTLDPTSLGSLGEFPVQVANPAPGNGSNILTLTTYHTTALSTTTLVYDAHSNQIFAAIPNPSATNPNTIVPVNPITGAVGAPIQVGKNPTRLALSDDGHYLYVGFYPSYDSVGQIQRINLTTNTVDKTFTLPGSSTGVSEIHVVPGYPQMLAVSLSIGGSPSQNGIALFNDSGLVQYDAGTFFAPYAMSSFTFLSDPRLYGIAGGTGYSALAVLPSGFITLTPPACCASASGNQVVSDGTLLYTNNGQVWNPKSNTLLGTYPDLFFANSVIADQTAKRTFFLEDVASNISGRAVLSYDPSTFAHAGSLSFSLNGTTSSLVRSGADGFAFATDLIDGGFTDPSYSSTLVLFRSSLATPAASGPVVTSASPANLAVDSPATTITLTGSGFSADAVVSWDGNARATTYISSTSLQVHLTADDLKIAGTGQISVKNVAAGQASADFAFQVIGAAVTFSPNSISFPAQTINTTSMQQAITLTNTSGAAFSNLNLAVIGTDATLFAQSNNCLATLAAGASCTASITFTPASSGTKTASLIVQQGAVPLADNATITGISGTPSFSLSKTSYDFAAVGVGLSSSQAVANITNSSSVPLSNLRMTLAGANSADFTVISGTCLTNPLTPGSSCYAAVTFTPQTTGAKTSVLTISADNAASQQVTLTGNGARIGLSVAASNLSFGNIVVGDTKTATTIITNTGEITLNNLQAQFDSGDTSLGDYQYGTDCPLTPTSSIASLWSLAPGQSCTFTLMLAPTRLGAISNGLVFGLTVANGYSSPLVNVARPRINYTANGTYAFGLSSTSVDLGSTSPGQTVDKTISLTSANGYTFSLQGAMGGSNSSDFSYTSDCPSSVTASVTCTLHVLFAPTTTGQKTASLTLTPQRIAKQTIYPYGLVNVLPQTITLSGTSSDFAIGGGSGSGNTAATVTAGQPAVYSLLLAETGTFQGTVVMSCGNLPQYASCSFTPSSVTIGDTPTVINLSVNTQQTVTTSARRSSSRTRVRNVVSLALLCGIGFWANTRRRGSYGSLLRMAAVVLSISLLFAAGCSGGSSSSNNSGTTSGTGGTSVKMTPSGTYAINVIATSGTVSHSQTVSLVVR